MQLNLDASVWPNLGTVALSLVNNFIFRYGIPREIVRDRGTEFINATMDQLCNVSLTTKNGPTYSGSSVLQLNLQCYKLFEWHFNHILLFLNLYNFTKYFLLLIDDFCIQYLSSVA